ncbi:MAG: electron transfer flavoprotein subunit beta/FixA family protein [Anaerolineales bacterium]
MGGRPPDPPAVETALQQQEAYGGDVTVICMGDESSKEALKHALAMGCGEAILISDPALKSVDSLVTSKVLAAAIQKIGEVDMAFFGKQAIDGDVGVTAAQTARVLNWPAFTLVSTISNLNPDSGEIQVERSIEEGRQIVKGKLPAAVSVVKDIGEPRYPSFMGIRKASRATIPEWSLEDLGLEALTPSVVWPDLMNPPTREIKTEIISGESPKEVAEKLADKILEEKVL